MRVYYSTVHLLKQLLWYLKSFVLEYLNYPLQVSILKYLLLIRTFSRYYLTIISSLLYNRLIVGGDFFFFLFLDRFIFPTNSKNICGTWSLLSLECRYLDKRNQTTNTLSKREKCYMKKDFEFATVFGVSYSKIKNKLHADFCITFWLFFPLGLVWSVVLSLFGGVSSFT